MIKTRFNHPVQQTPKILQIPKPLQLRRTARKNQSPYRIRPIGYIHCQNMNVSVRKGIKVTKNCEKTDSDPSKFTILMERINDKKVTKGKHQLNLGSVQKSRKNFNKSEMDIPNKYFNYTLGEDTQYQRMRTYDHTQNQEQFQKFKYVRTQPCQILQPNGDTDQSFHICASQLKQPIIIDSQNQLLQTYKSPHFLNPQSQSSQTIMGMNSNCSLKVNNYLLKTSRSCSKTQVLSSDRLMKKSKPISNQQKATSQYSIIFENEILRLQNQKLKEISHQRKNQISILIKQILQLKYQISNLVDQSDTLDQFKIIQKSLSLQFDGEKQKYRERQSMLMQNKQETRKSIVKQIFNKLKQTLYIEDNVFEE